MKKSTLTLEETKVLVEKLKKNYLSLREEKILYDEICRSFTPHKMNNHIFNKDEIKEEFIWGTWSALFRAKLDVGNPLTFALNRGYNATLDYYRKVSSEKLLLVCQSCGHKMAYDRRNTECHKCKSTKLKSHERIEFYGLDTDRSESLAADIHIENDFESKLLIDKLIVIIKRSNLKEEEIEIIIQAIRSNKGIFETAQSAKSFPFAKSLINKLTIALEPYKQEFYI